MLNAKFYLISDSVYFFVSDFNSKVGIVEQNYIDLLNDFREKGNIHTHSLFNLPHQDFIEQNKEKINHFIRRLVHIKRNL